MCFSLVVVFVLIFLFLSCAGLVLASFLFLIRYYLMRAGASFPCVQILFCCSFVWLWVPWLVFVLFLFCAWLVFFSCFAIWWELVHISFVSKLSFVVFWFGFGHIGAQLVLPLLVAFAFMIQRLQRWIITPYGCWRPTERGFISSVYTKLSTNVKCYTSFVLN